MDNPNSQSGMIGFQPGVPVVQDSFAQANDIIRQTFGMKPMQQPVQQMEQTSNQGRQLSQYEQEYQQRTSGQQTFSPMEQQLLRAADIITEQRAREVAESRTPRFMQRQPSTNQVSNDQGNQIVAQGNANQQVVNQQGVDDLTSLLFGKPANQAPSGTGQQAGQPQVQQQVKQDAGYDEVSQFSGRFTDYNAGLAKVAMQRGIDPDALFQAVSQFSPEKLANAVIQDMMASRSAGNQQQVDPQYQQQIQQGINPVQQSPNYYNQEQQEVQPFSSIVNAPKLPTAPSAGRSSIGSYMGVDLAI